MRRGRFLDACTFAPKPKGSSESLTREQVAVYRAVLEDYLSDSADTRNLANTTEPSESSSASFDGGCPRMSSPQVTDASASIVHRLDLTVTLNLKIATGRPARSAISIGTHALG